VRPFPWQTPVPVAHRGAHGDGRPENSPAALRHALALGAPAVELDVHRLGDGTLVAWHHDWAADYGGARRRVAELTRRDTALRPVEDLLAELAGAPPLVVFDWKGFGAERRIGALLERFGLRGRTLVSSIHPSVLAGLRRTLPWLPTGLSFPARAYRDTPDLHHTMATLLDDADATAAMIDRRLATPALVARARALGRGLFLWTARHPADYEAMAALGPDGVMTDAIEAQMGISSSSTRSPQ
jgi:glycerophosphoryl diester phosphodiesterase